MQHVEVKRRFAAPRQKVWDVYTDHVGWQEWTKLGKVRLDPPGKEHKNGVGCVRVITAAGYETHEEIVGFDPPNKLTYRVIKGGLPFKGHLGEVFFTDDGKGTLIVWKCRFESKIPGLGGLMARFVASIFRGALSGLDRKLQRG